MSKMLQSYSPPTSSMSNALVLGKQMTFPNAPYYREYLNQFKGTGGSGQEIVSRALKNDDGMLEAVDIDTSMRYSSKLFSYKVPEGAFAPVVSEMMTLGDENPDGAFKFDHVSNAAFIYYPNSADGPPTSSMGSIGRGSGESSISTVSPSSGDRESSSLTLAIASSERSRIEVSSSVTRYQKCANAHAHELGDNEEVEVEIVDIDRRENAIVTKPSYKEVLEMNQQHRETPTSSNSSPKSPQNTADIEIERKKAAIRNRALLQKSKDSSKKSSSNTFEDAPGSPERKFKDPRRERTEKDKEKKCETLLTAT